MTMRTKPFAHQATDFEAHKDDEFYARFWEQGVGKTKPTIDEICHAFTEDDIDAALVVAPNGVHLNWVTDEWPAHSWESVDALVHPYDSGRAGTKRHKSALERLIRYEGLAVLCISYDAFMTQAGKRFVWRFLQRRHVFYTLDESQMVKVPSTKRTKSVVASGRHASRRRILSGTPIAESPFDAYSQLRFLDEDIWRPLGIRTFAAFKTHFGEWESFVRNDNGQKFQKLKRYRNLDQLNSILSTVGSRLLKTEVLALPPKLYQKVYFEMTPAQRKIYEDIRTQFSAELKDRVECPACAGRRGQSCVICWGDGDIPKEVNVPLAMTRLLRLQQVTCGYVPADEDEEPTNLIEGKNPRLRLLQQVLDQPTSGKDIVFARFRKDIDLIMEMLGDRAVRYDGQVSSDDRAAAKLDFQKGDAEVFVANQQVGATGLTLNAATRVTYYSNNFSLTQRLQSEDRAHRIGQEHPVTYVDIVCQDTVDTSIVDALRKKQEIAGHIIGDSPRSWI